MKSGPRTGAKPHDRAEYLLYFALLYPFCLLRAVTQVLDGRRDGLLRRAMDDTNAIVPWIFSGH